MPDSLKICPICAAPNHRHAARCYTCGAALSQVNTNAALTKPRPSNADYDFRYGETDLLEDNLRRTGQFFFAGIVVLLLTLMAGGLGLALGPVFFSGDTATQAVPIHNNLVNTNTPRPTLELPTVTPGPPTLTPSPTLSPSPTATLTPVPTPCLQEVQAGDGLYNIILRCGHRDLSVIDLVMELNGITDPTSILPGQIIEVPWPTPTPDPNATATPEPENTSETSASGEVSPQQVSAFDENFDPLFIPTATLQPGIMYHTVAAGENVIIIALTYGANVEILSQLNPEIAFSQCDFSLDFGGPRCTVILIEGQQIRVPAPTGTPTLPPTPSGSETATPTPTATFNAPSAVSPSNRAFFRNDQLVTLRWIGSGTLAPGQSYRLRIENVGDGIVYTVDTVNNSFIIPLAWQGQTSRRFEYTWSVSVIDLDRPDSPYFTTPTLTFIWEGRSQD